MKNRVTNYVTKVSTPQNKADVFRKKFMDNEMLCQSAMSELSNIYWHEKELLIAIPLLMCSAKTIELINLLTTYHNYTKEHV